ncbi:MAG: citrate synthase [Coriobacteriales bacterium]|jgi:citrate synthase|nr:citrate synthase [Coriobacteriales bacterium]
MSTDIIRPEGADTSESMALIPSSSFAETNSIAPELYAMYQVKRGLRNDDGTGVVAGITNISDVHGYALDPTTGAVIPDKGRLSLRGYDIVDLLAPAFEEGRFCFEEISYLLMMGSLPTSGDLERFRSALDIQRELPDGFTSHYIMNPGTPDIMNCLARSVQILYASDAQAETRSDEHEARTAISLLSRLPRIMVLAYYAKQATFYNGSMIMHRFIPEQSTAETILSMLRPNRVFTHDEALMLDIMLSLHAEHGGGNNSTFTCRVVTSSDTDPYSAYSAAIGSLKGSRHGGANAKVLAMLRDIEAGVEHWDNDDELASYLENIVRRKAFDGSGLIYGMGHAVYTLSDPRAELCLQFARRLAAGTPFEQELLLLESIERLAPSVLEAVKGPGKVVSANVDMYSGLVYTMLGVPEDLFTPLFACGRMAGWAAHRFEEIVSGKRIIRPAYKTTGSHRDYVPMEAR